MPAHHDILMITHQRPQYTRMALERLLETCADGMRVWIWQNGEHAETLDVIRGFSNHPNFHRLEISAENKRLREPTNWFWSASDAEFVSKVDDDCLLDDGWSQKLVAAHRAAPELGIIAAWRFYEGDFDERVARRKIRDFPGGHRLMLNCWVQGSGYVAKRELINRLGPLRPGETFSDYGIRAALGGWVNGWYFPFIHEEHMDDARSPYFLMSDEEFRRNPPLTAITHGIRTIEEWRETSRRLAHSLQAASPDPRQYVGWRRRARNAARRVQNLFRSRGF
ncbi:glycosyltransferase family 2 protein [bacterium]|nr:glycosyltransferase family 2 protein [bacterium]